MLTKTWWCRESSLDREAPPVDGQRSTVLNGGLLWSSSQQHVPVCVVHIRDGDAVRREKLSFVSRVPCEPHDVVGGPHAKWRHRESVSCGIKLAQARSEFFGRRLEKQRHASEDDVCKLQEVHNPITRVLVRAGLDDFAEFAFC